MTGIPEFPVQCSGSFCHGRNIHAGPSKLCPACRQGKRRHNQTERGRWANVQRANRTRRALRYSKSVELYARNGGVRPKGLRGLDAFRRLTGMKIL
jgi:hypothetical protein